MTSKVTAVLELWPSGHSSPKHQHGGCAGSVRLVHGKLRMKLYKTLQSEEAMEIPGQQTFEVISSSFHLNDSPSNPEPSLSHFSQEQEFERQEGCGPDILPTSGDHSSGRPGSQTSVRP